MRVRTGLASDKTGAAPARRGDWRAEMIGAST
jgi:hypothetical protein